LKLNASDAPPDRQPPGVEERLSEEA